MKQLTCEMCGSTDLLKQDGVFVCQSCGCKYSVEEARKMMVEGTVEVQGTVMIDRTDEKRQKVQNYLAMCKNAHDALDTAAVVEYSDKILEIDPNNYEAWAYRALSCGWKSSLNDMKTGQVITAARKALELAPEEKRYELAENIYAQGKLQIISHLKTVFSMNSTGMLLLSVTAALTTASKQAEMIAPVMKAWVMLVTSIPYLTAERMEAEIKDCKEVSDSHDVIIGTAVSALNGKKPYYEEMRELLQPKMEVAKQEYSELMEKHRAAYWTAHAEEKAALEQEKKALERELSAVLESLHLENSEEKQRQLKESIDAMIKERNSLGMFKIKRTEELNKLIKKANDEITAIEKALNGEELKPINARIAEIDAELTKDRM